MTFEQVLDQAVEMLRRQGRVSYRALRRQFALDAAALDDLRFELVEVRRVGQDEGGLTLVWIGETGAPAPERRQLTVMFCDLAESTRLSSELDPEDLRDVIRSYQQTSVETIQTLGGHVAQYLGDGLLVYFGYPQAHEDDAARAVRAGLGILDRLAALNARVMKGRGLRLAVRVGIHTGPVVVGDVGGGDRHERLALGETPNIAARVQALAEPDTVVISEATHELVRGYFACDARGTQTLKGISRPVAVFRVREETGARGRLEATAAGLTPLVGRDTELALLHARWADAREGRGQVVLLGGEPGIGKSRLVHELRERAATNGSAGAEFRGSPYHENSALYPVIDHLQRRLEFTREETAEERLGRLEALLAASGMSALETVPLIAPLLSLPVPERYPPLTLSAEKRRQRTRDVLVRWVLATAVTQPLLLICEDLHWADPSTLELLEVLIEEVPGARMLVVATFRPGFSLSWSGAKHVTAIVLDRVTDQHAQELIRDVAGERGLPPELVRQIVEKADGVPLFVEELARMLVEAAPSPSLEIPSTLQDSLMARLDRLRPGKAVAQLGAVLGREFSHDLLQAVSPWDAATLERGLEQLVEAQLAQRRGEPPDVRYLFKHALVRDTAYQSLLRSTRHQYHGLVARALVERFPEIATSQPELVAQHCLEGGLHVDAIEYLDRANEQAARGNALVEALRYFEDAMRLLDDQPPGESVDRRRLGLLLRQVPVFRGLFRYPDYHELLRRNEGAAARLGDAGLAAALDVRLGFCDYATGEYDRAIARLRAAVGVCEAHGRVDDAALGNMAWAWAALFKGDLEEGIARSSRAIELTDREHHLQYRVLARFARSVCQTYRGRWSEAMAEAERGLADAERYDDDSGRAMAWTALGMAHTFRGAPERGAEFGRQALAKAPTPVDRSLALFGLTEALCMGADPAAGIEMAMPLVTLARLARHRSVEIIAVALGEAYLGVGNLADARATLEEARRLCAESGIAFALCRAHRAMGELELADSPARPEQAEAAFEQGLALCRVIGAENELALTAAAYGRLLARRGRTSEARHHLAEALETFNRLQTFERLDAPDEPGRIRAELAALPA